MSNIALEVRPAILGALLLTLGLAVSLECAPRSECSKRTVSVIRMPRPVIVPMQPAPPRGGPGHAGDVLTPPAHPDARPWPLGMVITPPPTHDPINQLPGTVERLVAAVLATLLPPSA